MEAKEAKERANKWTGIIYTCNRLILSDNIFLTKQWLIGKNPSLTEEQLNTHFEIPSDLDNL
jgi:hypothetical protein